MGVRERRDVRPVDVARALNVSQATVSDWEAGKVTPREEMVERLAAFLGVTPEFLRYGILPETTFPKPDPALDRKVTPAELVKTKVLVSKQPKRRRRSG